MAEANEMPKRITVAEVYDEVMQLNPDERTKLYQMLRKTASNLDFLTRALSINGVASGLAG